MYSMVHYIPAEYSSIESCGTRIKSSQAPFFQCPSLIPWNGLEWLP